MGKELLELHKLIIKQRKEIEGHKKHIECLKYVLGENGI